MLSKFNHMPIGRRIILGFMIPIVISALVLYVTWVSIQTISASARAVAQDQEEAMRFQQVLEACVNGETSSRGFLITGNEAFLEPMRLGREQLDRVSVDLRRRLTDPQQFQKWGEVERLIRTEWLPYHYRLISRRRAATPATLPGVHATVAQGQGKRYMDSIRSGVSELRAMTEVKLRAHMADQVRAADQIIAVVLGGAAATIVSGLLMAFLIARSCEQAIGGAVNAISSTSTQIAASVTEHERTASLQAASVSETTATMDELEASFQQAGDVADTAAERARIAMELADEGNQTVHETLERMRSLQERVGAIADQILRLSEQTAQIGAITTFVSDLANQTNLLALNAAVEAARAGEHGRGFAVVAAEIRKLADQSKQSAERIHGLVADIQHTTNSTVMVTEEGSKTVAAGMQRAESTAQTFNELADALNVLYESAQQSSLGLRQQITAVRQVVEAMETMNAGARETAAGVAQTKTGIDRLQDTALSLNTLVKNGRA